MPCLLLAPCIVTSTAGAITVGIRPDLIVDRGSNSTALPLERHRLLPGTGRGVRGDGRTGPDRPGYRKKEPLQVGR